MAQEWLKKYLHMKPEVSTLFDDLDAYREFCVDYGYSFNESHLYNDRTPWGEMQRVRAGKPPKDNWSPHPKTKEWKPKGDWKSRDRQSTWRR